MLKINNIIHDSIVDGPGIRSVVFTQGCPHLCEGCHNVELLSNVGGKEMAIMDIVGEIELNNFTKKVTISGGEPLVQNNVIGLIKELKELNYHIMVYTGYTIDEVRQGNQKEILDYIDILVDGKFEMDKRDISLQYYGSTNQKLYTLSK